MQISFKSLPMATKVATVLTFFAFWVLFEELIIDRHHLDRFLPLYRVGNLCIYDLTVAGLLLWMWVRLNRSEPNAS